MAISILMSDIFLSIIKKKGRQITINKEINLSDTSF